MGDRLTKSDVEKIEKEIEYRKLVVRKEALEAVKEARAQGDLSENFEYHAAKRFKNQNDSRIRYLERMINTATIIEDSSDSPDTAGLNKKVTVYFVNDDEEDVYTITTTIRENAIKGFISNVSPLGKALVGHKVGDTVTVHVNDTLSYPVTIRKIEPADEIGTIRSF